MPSGRAASASWPCWARTVCRWERTSPSTRALGAVALAGAVVLGLAIGIPIAWFSLRGYSPTRCNPSPAAARPAARRRRLRHGFIVAQIALAFVLLAGAGLLGLSLRRSWPSLPDSGPRTS